MIIFTTVLLTMFVTALMDFAVLKAWLYKAKNQSYPSWECFVEAARKDGVSIHIRNDAKGNDVDRFFNGEAIHVDFSPKIDDPNFQLPGEIQVQFIKDN